MKWNGGIDVVHQCVYTLVRVVVDSSCGDVEIQAKSADHVAGDVHLGQCGDVVELSGGVQRNETLHDDLVFLET